MNRVRFVLLLLFLVVFPAMASPLQAAPVAQQPDCLFFTETGGGQGGYAVCDDAQARFRTAFEGWGLQKIGYPISQRYERDGFVTQAFQKAIMQWRADSQSVVLVNIFDDLHNMGFDEKLNETRQTPFQLPAGWDGEGVSFEEIVARRQALLDARPALRQAYFASSEPLTFFGLPTSEVSDMGNHYAIRLQRAVLQEWKEDVPWATAGQVTIANGGDIAKELGGLPVGALTPQASGTTGPIAPQPPAPTAVANDPFERVVPLGKEFQVPHWGLTLYDVKKTKAIYWYDEVSIAQGIYLIPMLEFRNTGRGTANPNSNLDFYLQDAAGRIFEYDYFMIDSTARLGAGWQFQTGLLYDKIHPGSMLGISLPLDISPTIGDIWLRVNQAPDVVIYLGNVSQMPELK